MNKYNIRVDGKISKKVSRFRNHAFCGKILLITAFFAIVLLSLGSMRNSSKELIYNREGDGLKLSAGEPGAFSIASNSPEIWSSTGSVQFTWWGSSGANNFSFYESNHYFESVVEPGVNCIATGITNKYYFRSYTFNGTYFYRVVAFNNNGNTTSTNCYQVNVNLVDIYRELHGGTSFENAQKIAYDNNGNIFVADTQGHGGIPYRDLTISKYYPNGTLSWRSGYITDEHSFGLSCDADSFGNSYGAGYITVGSTTFMLLAKFDPTGAFQWNRTRVIGTNAYAKGVVIDSTDSIILAGYSASITNNIVVVKYNAAGTELWAKTWDSGNDDVASDIIVDAGNNLYMVGYTNGKGIGGYDAVVIKLDSNGNELWNKTWGTSYDEATYDSGHNAIALDSQNNIYITTASIWSTQVSTLKSFLVKFDSNGNYLWNVTEDLSSNEEHLNDLQIDAEDKIFVCGYYYASSTLKTDSVVFWYNFDGSKLWTHYYSTTSFENPESITIANGYAYMTGKEWVWIISLAPRPFTLSESADNPDTNGIYDVSWSGSQRCNNYSLYVSNAFFNWTEVGIRPDITLIKDGLTNSSYQLNYMPDGTYYYRVLSYNRYGYSTSNYVAIPVQNRPPGDFSLSSDAGTPFDRDGAVNITWTASHDAVTYNIYEWDSPITEYNSSLNIIAEDLTVLQYAITGLVEGPHYIAVTAVDHNGWTLSNNINAIVQYGPPNAFTLLVDSPDDIISRGNFQLDWTRSEGAHNYTIWMSPYSGCYSDPVKWEATKLKLDNGIASNTLQYYVQMLYPYYGWSTHFQIEATNQYGSTLSNIDYILFNSQTGWNYWPYAVRIRTNAGLPDVDGNFSLIWEQMTSPYSEPLPRADYYDIYMNDTNFIEADRYAYSSLICSHATNVSLNLFNLADGRYYFRIVAVNTYGIRVSPCIYVDVFNYDMPVLVASNTATNPEYDGIVEFSWNQAESTNFSIYSYPSPITSINSSLSLEKENITGGLSCSFTNLADGARYYVVVAKHMYGDIISNNMYINVYKSSPTIPVLNSDASSPDYDGSFTLSWTGTQYADNFSIYYFDSFITEINETVSILAEGYTSDSYLTSVTLSGQHYYKVVAFNRLGNGTSTCLEIDTMLMIPYNSIVTSTANTPDPDGNYVIEWTSAQGAVTYTLYHFSAPITEINGSLDILAPDSTDLSFTIIAAADGVHYYAIGSSNPLGTNLSAYIVITVYYPRPAPFSVSPLEYEGPDTDGSFNITWTTSNYAQNYSIYMSTQSIEDLSGDVTLLSSNLTNNSIAIKGLNSGTYHFVVVAYNDYGMYISADILITVEIPQWVPPSNNTPPDDSNLGLILGLILGGGGGIAVVVVIYVKKRGIRRL